MKKETIGRGFVLFLSASLLLLMSGSPLTMAEAKENLPIGEMVSRGEVQFEARENLWKRVESSHFPILQGMKMKTGNGGAIIALENNTRIEVGQKSLFSFDSTNRFNLSQGRIDFSIPSTSEMDLKVRKLTIMKSRPLQAGKDTVAGISKSEGAIGAVLIHPNGSVTVKSLGGSLTVLGQDRAVLASLSSKESVTVPAVTASGTMVAQAPVAQEKEDSKKPKEGAGLVGQGEVGLLGALGGIAGAAGGAVAASTSSGGEQPVCR
jgi:hypothetical protein